MREPMLLLLIGALFVSPVTAEEDDVLPAQDEVFAIAVHPSDSGLGYFTPESLKAALPELVLGVPDSHQTFRMRPPQRGVIVLKDGTTLFWFTQDNQSLFIETADSYHAYVVKDGRYEIREPTD